MSLGNSLVKVKKEDMRLYAVTGRTPLDPVPLEKSVELALQGGATFVQLREKHADAGELLSLALKIKAICKKYGVPFVVNDNVEVALRADADGVHIGQSDESLSEARKTLGDCKIIGVSVQTVQQAVSAERGGADYLGIGSVFSTSTKLDAIKISGDTLREITSSVSIPTVAIGGISKENISYLKGTGVDGVAVVSAVFGQRDVFKAAQELKKLSLEVFGE